MRATYRSSRGTVARWRRRPASGAIVHSDRGPHLQLDLRRPAAHGRVAGLHGPRRLSVVWSSMQRELLDRQTWTSREHLATAVSNESRRSTIPSAATPPSAISALPPFDALHRRRSGMITTAAVSEEAGQAPSISQALHVTDGEARVQARGGDVTTIRLGDTNNFAAGEWHYYGAAPDRGCPIVADRRRHPLGRARHRRRVAGRLRASLIGRSATRGMTGVLDGRLSEQSRCQERPTAPAVAELTSTPLGVG